MSFSNSSVRSAEALERALRHLQQLAEARSLAPVPEPTPPPLSIALSRECGANGSVIAKMVGERLGWPIYDRTLLLHIAEEMGLHSTLLESVDERNKHWFRQCLEAFIPPPVTTYTYARRVVEAVLSLGAHGECVIVGRGAANILPAATTLRVRVVAPLSARVATVQARHGLTRDEAARRVATTDAERHHFVKHHFHVDVAAPWNYDLVVNSSSFTLLECVDLIVEGLRCRRERATETVAAPVSARRETVATP